MSSTRLQLVGGERLEVDGNHETVEKLLQDAARSTAGTLVWLKDVDGDEPVAVNPAHVVTLRPGDP
jgi:hypothetical protein